MDFGLFCIRSKDTFTYEFILELKLNAEIKENVD